MPSSSIVAQIEEMETKQVAICAVHTFYRYKNSISTRDATRIATQGQADAFIASVKADPRCWELCCERFSSTQHIEVQFWCVKTLHEVRLNC